MFCFVLKIKIESDALNLIFCFGESLAGIYLISLLLSIRTTNWFSILVLGMCSGIINPIIYGSFNFCNRHGKTLANTSRTGLPCQPVRVPIDGRTTRNLRNMYDPYYYAHANAGNSRLVISFKSNRRHFIH